MYSHVPTNESAKDTSKSKVRANPKSDSLTRPSKEIIFKFYIKKRELLNLYIYKQT
jgi:hypothetical protein